MLGQKANQIQPPGSRGRRREPYRKRSYVSTILAATILGACHPIIARSRSDAVVFAERSATVAMLRQCSRDTPSAGEASWDPGWSDIAPLESALPRALALSPEVASIPGGSSLAHSWRRQYVGIVRGGRRYIYGNFLNQAGLLGETDDWRRSPFTMCDGGGNYFGVEWDVSARRIDRLDLNYGERVG